MRHLLLLFIDQSGWTKMTPAEQAAGMAAYRAYNEALAEAGALVTTGALAPAEAASTIRTKGGRPVTLDGPFAETKEQVAGFYLIETADREAALAWAARCPAADHGVVEVREVS